MRGVSKLVAAVVVCGCSASSSPTGPGAASSSSGGSSSSGSSGTPIGASVHGVATYYAATGAGNCGFDPSPNDLDVAAMNAAEYAGSAVCGECVDVTGPSGKVTVRIVDQCPDCQSGQLDLSKEAFAKISPVSAGRVTIDWQVVPCNVTGPVAYLYKDGSSQYWTAIQIRNHRLPIASLEIQAAGAWAPVNRADYNYFVDDKGAGTGQVHVRITASDGQKLEDTLPPVQAGATAPGAAQFQ